MACELIAEISTNHGGSVELATQFVNTFAPYVDTIKGQLTRVQHLRPTDPQYEWFRRSQLSLDEWSQVKTACERAGVRFLLTAYHADEVPLVKLLGCTRIKIGSGEAMEPWLAAAVREAELMPLVSCGLTTPLESTFHTVPHAQFLGCVTRYPSPSGIAAAMLMKSTETWTTYMYPTGLVGWSDHAVGLDECKAAIAGGAQIVEAHVCLPQQARIIRPFEKTVEEMKELRAFADEDPTRFIGRWQYA